MGGLRLTARVRRYQPRYLAILGVGAYRTAFDQAKATVGRQPQTIGETILWVLPNPSGLNANYQRADLARLLAAADRALYEAKRTGRDRAWSRSTGEVDRPGIPDDPDRTGHSSPPLGWTPPLARGA